MMSNYSLPLFMQVKENAVQDLNKNLSLYMPKLIHTKTLILTTDGLLQTLEKKVVVLLKQLLVLKSLPFRRVPLILLLMLLKR